MPPLLFWKFLETAKSSKNREKHRFSNYVIVPHSATQCHHCFFENPWKQQKVAKIEKSTVFSNYGIAPHSFFFPGNFCIAMDSAPLRHRSSLKISRKQNMKIEKDLVLRRVVEKSKNSKNKKCRTYFYRKLLRRVFPKQLLPNSICNFIHATPPTFSASSAGTTHIVCVNYIYIT